MKKPDFVWYRLNKRGEERFVSIKEAIKKYNPDIDQSVWYRARMQLVRGIAPPKVFTVAVEIDGHSYTFSQKLHFEGFETSWVRRKGFVTRAKKTRGLR